MFPKEVISCNCFSERNRIVVYTNAAYPESYHMGEFSVINMGNSTCIVEEYGIDYCPYCKKRIEVKN